MNITTIPTLSRIINIYTPTIDTLPHKVTNCMFLNFCISLYENFFLVLKIQKRIAKNLKSTFIRKNFQRTTLLFFS